MSDIVYSGGPYINSVVTMDNNGSVITDALLACGWTADDTNFKCRDPYLDFGTKQPCPMRVDVAAYTEGALNGVGRDDGGTGGTAGVRVGVLIGKEATIERVICDTADPACEVSTNCVEDPDCCIAVWTAIHWVYRAFDLKRSANYRIIANPYSFFIIQDLGPVEEASSFVAAGTLYSEPLGSTINRPFGEDDGSGPYCWWIFGNHTGTLPIDATYLGPLRTTPYTTIADPFFYRHTNGLACWEGGFEVAPDPDPCPNKTPTPRRLLTHQSVPGYSPQLVMPNGASGTFNAPGNLAWHPNQPYKMGARMAFDIGEVNNPYDVPVHPGTPRVSLRGQLYDCCIIMDAHPSDVERTFDGHTWRNVLHDGQCGLWVVVA